MKFSRSFMGENRRFLVLMFLITISLTLAPTIMAPPERNFISGQPELQQSMDNMAREEEIIKRSLQFPSGDVKGYPALLTHKTSDLLSEAEHMLNRVKNLKERRWVEAFVHRLKLLAAVLEQSVIQHPDDNYTIDEAIESSKKTALSNSSTSPTSTPLQETAILAINQQQVKMMTKYPVTVPQRNEMLAVNDLGSERQVVMRPGLTSSMPEKKSSEDEDDELVKELEDLHKIASIDNQQQSLTPPTVTGDENVEILAPEEAEKVENPNVKEIEMEENLIAEEVEKKVNPVAEETKMEANPVAEETKMEANPVAEETKMEASPAINKIEKERNPTVNETEKEVNPIAEEPEKRGNSAVTGAEMEAGVSLKEVDTSPIEAPAEALPPKRMMSTSLNELIIEDEKAKIKQNLAKEIAELERLGESEEQILSEFRHRNGHYLFPGPKYQHMMLNPNPNTGNVVNRYEQEFNPMINGRPIHRPAGPMVPYPRANFWRPPPAVYPAYRPFRPAYINNSVPGMYMGMTPMNHPIYNRQFPMGNASPQANLQLYHDGIKETIQKLQQEHQNFLMNNPAAGMPQMPNPNYGPNQYLQPNYKYQNNPSMSMIPDRGARPIYTPYPYMPTPNHQNYTVHGSPVYGNGFAPNPYPNHNINNEFNDEMKRQLRDGKVILLSDSVVRSNFQQDAKKNPEKPNEGKDGTTQENKIDEKKGTGTE